MSLGDNIKTARLNMNLSQKELANLLTEENNRRRKILFDDGIISEKEYKKNYKISNTAISNWEQNINKPDADIIAIICKILNVDANFLLNYNIVKTDEDDLLSEYLKLLQNDDKLTDIERQFLEEFMRKKHS